ncbi:ABC transporter permease [Longispora sp. NPDC051575]|uniref:ABC transporter permease n=1 Tax=Longispora sp. NPDC051575 TaxID=3154943 RepID=UPI003442E3B0
MGFWNRSRKAGAVYVVLGLFAFAFFGLIKPATEQVVLKFTDDTSLTFGPRAVILVLGLLTVAAGGALLAGRDWFPTATAVALLGFVGAFMLWAVSLAKVGHTIYAVDLVNGTLIAALPLIFGSLGGVLCERSGVVNINIEGQLLIGAFGGALVGTLTQNVWAGIVAGAVFGALMAALLAVFAIKYLVDQVVLGVILNVLAIGITGVIYERLMQPEATTYNQPPKLDNWNIPLLSDIPFLGPALFRNNVFVYLALILVGVVTFALFRTRWGLRTRAVGEHPTAADTVGIKVRAVRYRNVILGGLVAGLGGAALTLGSGLAFNKNMTAGKGFIALAAVIFGRWSPTGALGAALLFGFADKLQTVLSSTQSPIPSDFLRMAPYIATLFAVAGLVGKVRAPAADGKPYVKG